MVDGFVESPGDEELEDENSDRDRAEPFEEGPVGLWWAVVGSRFLAECISLGEHEDNREDQHHDVAEDEGT